MPAKGDRRALLEEHRTDEAGRLGRHLHHDPRSREYPVEPLLGEARQRKRLPSTVWWRRSVYDQGATSSCVGQACVGALDSSPYRRYASVQGVDPYAVYREAQRHDPWPGAEPDYFGTSTLAGMKALRVAGLVDEYRWCFGLEDVLRTLATYGPVVVGTNWYEGMDRPGEDGRVRLDGEARGGHAYLLVSTNPEERTVRAVNSWGHGWGDRGRLEMTWDDLGRLLAEDGEAVVPVFTREQRRLAAEEDEDEG